MEILRYLTKLSPLLSLTLSSCVSSSNVNIESSPTPALDPKAAMVSLSLKSKCSQPDGFDQPMQYVEINADGLNKAYGDRRDNFYFFVKPFKENSKPFTLGPLPLIGLVNMADNYITSFGESTDNKLNPGDKFEIDLAVDTWEPRDGIILTAQIVKSATIVIQDCNENTKS